MNVKLSNPISIVLVVLYVLFLPLVLLWKLIDPRNKETVLHKVTGIVLTCLILIPIWTGAYGLLGYVLAYHWGFIPQKINISGTGSMYPTFPKGIGTDQKALSKQVVSTPLLFRYPNGISLFGKRYFNTTIGHGDIVVVSNAKIKTITKDIYGAESTLVKRVIALPGDTLQIRDGIVYLNGAPQKEAYIAHARSTFGGPFLPDCQAITIPAHKYFLMGDNRKASGDSRQDVGLVDDKDVMYVLPYAKQLGVVDAYWHNPANDLANTAKITLDASEFANLLNIKRNQAGTTSLRFEPKLAVSAGLRGAVILKYNDFSFDATRSGYTMSQAVADAGYSNIVYGEETILGYYEAQELIDNLFEYPSGKKFLTDTQYNDVGVAEVDGAINSCPTHLIVLHFAGYVPPNYAKDVIDSWRNALSELQQVQPGWEKLKTYTDFYTIHKADIDELTSILRERIAGVTNIVTTMQANQWLTQDEKNYVVKDKDLEARLDVLTKKVNSYGNER